MFQEVDHGVALQLRQDQEAPSSALWAVAAKSCWEGVCPVDARRHAECDEVEGYSSGCFVKYVEDWRACLQTSDDVRTRC